ncbi:MAG: DUF4123 domain-containing protein [Candidatus Competibacteraceae bacterium]
MNADARLEALRRILYENGETRVYAVLDGASIPNLLSLLAEHAVEHVCLYRGELDPELAQTAPYLVHLPEESSFSRLFLRGGWGQHWGILVLSREGLRALRMHFRKFLMVSAPDGKPLYFRYYDPRVLRVYLPTCNGAELETLFGPVSAYVLEGEKPEVLLRFTRAGNALSQTELVLPPLQSV